MYSFLVSASCTCGPLMLGKVLHQKLHVNLFSSSQIFEKHLVILKHLVSTGKSVVFECNGFSFSPQAISRLCENKYKDLSKSAMRRSVSADNLVGVRQSQAVLS